MRYISLFAGIGGFDLALTRSGHECVFSNDWDKYCKQVYDSHFQTKLTLADIRDISAETIPEHDLLVGGFPCQSFSIAGKRMGFEDTRGTMFFEISRILAAGRPTYLMLENVKGLLNHDNGRTYETIIQTLDELGYDLQWQVLNSKDFGVPQNRERVFIIGHLRGQPRPQVFPLRAVASVPPAPCQDEQDSGERVCSTLDARYGGLRNSGETYIVPTGRRTEYRHGDNQTVIAMLTERRTEEAKAIRREMVKEGKDWSPRSEKELVPRVDGLGNTLTASQSNEHLLTDGVSVRRLTPLECEKLQGFPENWTEGVSDTQRYKMLGNAVTVPVVEEILLRWSPERSGDEKKKGYAMTQHFTAPDSHDGVLSIVPAAGPGEEKRQLLSLAASDFGSEFVYSSFRLHKNGLTPVGTPTREEWLECGRFIRHAEASVHFWIGDWLTYGEAHFMEDYEEAIKLTGYSYHTLRRDKYTAERIEPERRRPALDVAIHHEVAPLPESIQEELLTKAETHGYTVQQVRVEKKRIALETARPVVPSLPDSGLFLGDCLEVLKQFPDESVDLLLTDPPYGINYKGHLRTLPFDAIVNDTPEQAPPLLDKALAVASSKLKTNSHVFVFSSWRSLGWMLATVAKHFEVKTVLCWVKNYFGYGDYFGTFPSQYEMIIHAHKGRRLLEGETHGNALLFDHVPNNNLLHPAEKPLPLLEYLISRATRPGEVVCDPFMGSASTCLAARNTNRKYIGIEIDEKWFSLAQQRIAGHLLEKAA